MLRGRYVKEKSGFRERIRKFFKCKKGDYLLKHERKPGQWIRSDLIVRCEDDELTYYKRK